MGNHFGNGKPASLAIADLGANRLYLEIAAKTNFFANLLRSRYGIFSRRLMMKLAAILLGLLGAIVLTQPATAQSRFQKDFLGIDTEDLSSRQRDRVDEIRDDLNSDLGDVLSFDEIDELQDALDDGDNVDRAVDRLDLSDRRSRDVRDILRSAERDLRDIVGDRDRRNTDSIYAPGNWQRPVN
jgi:hypothetical protein